MLSQLSFLFLSLIVSNIEQKVGKETLKRIIMIIFLLTSILIITFTISINFEIFQSEFCENHIHNKKLLGEKEYVINFESISMFPETSKLSCFGKISSVNNQTEAYEVKIITSRLLLKYFNIFYGVLFVLSVLFTRNNNKNIIYLFLYILSDYFLNIYFFQKSFNLIYLIVKILYLYFGYKFFIDTNKLSKSKEFIGISFVLLIFVNPLNINFHPDELYYLGYAITNHDYNSAFFGNEQLYIYSLLVNALYSLFGMYAIPIIKVTLSIWLSYLIIKFSEYFKVDKEYRLLFAILLLSFQSFAGGDQFWGSFVPKNFCYLFIFTGIYFLLIKKNILPIVFFSLSIYFQMAAFLIWLPFIGFIYLSLKNFKEILLAALSVLFLSLPLIIRLINDNFGSSLTVEERNNNLQFIISDYLSNHNYPFIFENNQFQNINPDWIDDFRNIVLFLLIIVFLSFSKKYKLKEILGSLQIVSSVLIIYILFNFLFPINSFILLQPYKIISLLSIIFILYFVLLVDKKHISQSIVSVFLIINLLSYGIFIYEISNENFSYRPSFRTSELLKENILELEPVTLILPLYEQNSVQSELLDIEVSTNINTYVAYKYFPTTIKDTQLWQNRITNLRNFYNGDCDALKELKTFYFIDFSENDCGTIVYELENYIIFKNK